MSTQIIGEFTSIASNFPVVISQFSLDATAAGIAQ
jgi:hypothetical protein